MKILVVEDDQQTVDFVTSELLTKGHAVESVRTGKDGSELAIRGSFDALIIDRMLPDIDGASVVSELRNRDIFTPTIILSAMDGISQRVAGLEAGADDYLVKPFAFLELYARLCALVRRHPARPPSTVLTLKGLELDLLSRRVSYGQKSLELQSTEFKLLEYFMRRSGQIITRTMLLEGVWDFRFDPKTSIVETHISRLRTKLETICPKEIISTVRGAGYVIEDT